MKKEGHSYYFNSQDGKVNTAYKALNRVKYFLSTMLGGGLFI